MFLRRSKKTGATAISRIPDEDLIRRYREEGDPEYVGALFERYTHLVYGVCIKYLRNEEEGRDAVMEIFEGLMDGLMEHEVHNFRSWIYTVAKNHCLMMIRRKRPEEKMREGYLEKLREEVMESSGILHPYKQNAAEERIRFMMKGLAELSREQRKCLEMMYLQDKSYHEVSAVTGYSMKQVKSYIQNGKRNLKNYLNQNG